MLLHVLKKYTILIFLSNQLNPFQAQKEHKKKQGLYWKKNSFGRGKFAGIRTFVEGKEKY